MFYLHSTKVELLKFKKLGKYRKCDDKVLVNSKINKYVNSYTIYIEILMMMKVTGQNSEIMPFQGVSVEYTKIVFFTKVTQSVCLTNLHICIKKRNFVSRNLQLLKVTEQKTNEMHLNKQRRNVEILKTI